MASGHVEVDTACAFRSMKEVVTVFGECILVGESHCMYSGTGNDVSIAKPQADAKHEEGSSSSSTITLFPNAMAETDGAGRAAIVPMYSDPSSPPSLTLLRMQDVDDDNRDLHDGHDGEGGLAIMSSIKKLEAEVAETRREVLLLTRRGTEMEMAVATLNAQLHRGLSRLAELESDKATARRTTRGGTDVTAAMERSKRWAEKSTAYSTEYLPSFSHALNLGEIDDVDELLACGRRRKAHKVKPVVPLIGDILFSKSFSKRDSSSTKDGGVLYRVIGC